MDRTDLKGSDKNKKGSSNVVDFLSFRKKKQEEEDQQKVSFELEKRKFAASASLVSVLFLVTLANSNIMESKKSVPIDERSRMIASIDNEIKEGQIGEWLSRFVKSHQNKDSEGSVVASDPQTIDQLRYGLLEGKYALNFADDKFQSLKYISSPGLENHPVSIENTSDFLADYLKVFEPNATSIKLTHKSQIVDKKIETYKIIGINDKTLGVLSIEWTHDNRLLDLKKLDQ